MSKSTFEEQLEKNGTLVYTNVGTSMLPLIRQGKDVMIIQRPEEWKQLPDNSRTDKLKKLDVPLYKRKNGQYVLHRVVKVRKDDYVLRGDNTYSNEYGITDEQIIGILTGVIRNGKEISVNSFRYRIYSFLWYYSYWFRKFAVRVRRISK